jgi:Zn-dependent protease with chaperone function
MAAVVLLFLSFSQFPVYAAESASSDITSQEAKLRDRASEEIEKRWTVLTNPALQARVDTIIRRLEPFMRRKLDYDASIIDHEMVNAFALAGGKIYVTTGMLEFVKTDLELAGVLAHEMIHADRKHVIIQTARNNKMTLIAIAAAIASRGSGAALVAANALQVAVMGAYSIDIEKEADAGGIDALVLAGYTPVGMITLQERLKEERMKHPEVDAGIYQTHPEVDERIRAAEKYMDEHDIPVHRKHALGNLRASVGVVSGDLTLALDGEPVWLGRDDERTRTLFDRVAEDIWNYLQLETVPYEMRVEGDGARSSFFIGNKKIISEDEIPNGAQSLAELRDGIQRALNLARRSHPLADYYKNTSQN